VTEREKWSCDKCKTERFQRVQEELLNALQQIDELKFTNRELEEKLQLQLVGAGKRSMVAKQKDAKLQLVGDLKRDAEMKQKDAKCMVMGNSVLRKVGAEHTDMMVECFPGISAEQLHRMIEKRDLGNPETVIIHIGTNDLTGRSPVQVPDKVDFSILPTALWPWGRLSL
jgi:hypothetical protein